MNKKKIKEDKVKAIFYILLAFGLILFIGGVALCVTNNILQVNSVEVNATVSDIKIEYDPEEETYLEFAFVDYTYNGVNYIHRKYGYRPSDWSVGDDVKILIDKRDPAKVINTLNYTGGILLLIIGGVMTVAFSIVVINGVKKHKRNKKLKLTGYKLECYISSIITDTSYLVNNVPVDRIAVCKPVNNVSDAEYLSESYRRNNNLHSGQIVDVYLDINNNNIYWVDLNSYRDNPKKISNKYVENEKETFKNQKIKCPYCSSNYDDSLDRCPNCGANRK